MRGFVRAGLLVPIVALVLLGHASAAPVGVRQAAGEFKVTIAARFCPAYTDVSANRARNDIQESLFDLGRDSLYTTPQSANPVNPETELAGQPEPPCQPLVGWRFTLGTGIVRPPPPGDPRWGRLSYVTGVFDTPIVTRDSIPLLGPQQQENGRQLAAAVTITLTPEQARLAEASSRLWIQGGTPDDPVLYNQFGGVYGFAALRCAADNLNGDNVEWITFPQGHTHVFCFAYYVKPGPQAGTITVVKHVSSPANATQSFPFHGNLSFEPGGRFSLNVVNGNNPRFEQVRGETLSPEKPPWTFTEDVPEGWHLNAISCTSATGVSTFTTSVATATTSVRLASGDHVTCTYTDSLTPPAPGQLQITKTTLGGVGVFPYTVTPAGGGSSVGTTATTTVPGVPTPATPDTLTLAPGQYTIAEMLPSSNRGTWHLTSVTCNGHELPPVSPVTVAIEPTAGVICNFVNTLTPRGAIRIEKITFGKTGTFGFQIRPLPPLPQDVAYAKTANVTRQGTPVLATGDDTNALPLGRYQIQEFATAGADPEGWRLTSVVCNGRLLAASAGAVTVTLTPAEPRMSCIYTNTWTPRPPPEPPPDPDPTPTADIRVNKTPDRVTATVGDIVTYTITIRNVGNGSPANTVVLAEQTPLQTSRILSLTSTHGICRFEHHPAWCDLGIVRPGQTVTVTARLKATHVGSMPNNVAVNAATVDPTPPTDHTPGRVRPRPKPKPGGFTG